MAKSVSAEELQLRRRARRRLIGAITLVTVVAVFLPMILDHEPKPPQQDISIQIPSSDSGTFTSKIVPTVPGSAPGKGAKPTADGIPPKSEPAAQAERKAPVKDAEAPAPVKAAEPKVPAPAKTVEAKGPPVAATPSAPAAKGEFVVQVAALNDAAKAKQMQEQIAAAGIKSYTEVVPTTKGSVTRVRAGPYPSREAAEKTRDKLKEMGLTGNLVTK